MSLLGDAISSECSPNKILRLNLILVSPMIVCTILLGKDIMRRNEASHKLLGWSQLYHSTQYNSRILAWRRLFILYLRYVIRDRSHLRIINGCRPNLTHPRSASQDWVINNNFLALFINDRVQIFLDLSGSYGLSSVVVVDRYSCSNNILRCLATAIFALYFIIYLIDKSGTTVSKVVTNTPTSWKEGVWFDLVIRTWILSHIGQSY